MNVRRYAEVLGYARAGDTMQVKAKCKSSDQLKFFTHFMRH